MSLFPWIHPLLHTGNHPLSLCISPLYVCQQIPPNRYYCTRIRSHWGPQICPTHPFAKANFYTTNALSPKTTRHTRIRDIGFGMTGPDGIKSTKNVCCVEGSVVLRFAVSKSTCTSCSADAVCFWDGGIHIIQGDTHVYMAQLHHQQTRPQCSEFMNHRSDWSRRSQLCVPGYPGITQSTVHEH